MIAKLGREQKSHLANSQVLRRQRYPKIVFAAFVFLLLVTIILFISGLIRSNQRLKAALQTVKQREEKRIRNAGFLADFRKVSQSHNSIKEKIYLLYQGQDWQEKFKSDWEIANDTGEDKEKIDKAKADMEEFLRGKEHDVKTLDNFIVIEKKNIGVLAMSAGRLDQKEATLATKMAQEMKVANNHTEQINDKLVSLLEVYKSFCEKRTDLLKGKITEEEFNQFANDRNIQIAEISKEIDSLIDKIKSFDEKVKELYEKIWLFLSK